ncbi:MAG TPA: Asp-tRNA(Asn)/Glu-tRNA(Gln) amidotransferase subunit GatC [Bacteroidota bacterium]|nr:Asp-tRNA(Asn)/Glu-tRNA(Gln) amidotransferase subunit GatC [Bacteroidota bacterium]
MAVTKNDVAHIAKLARLSFTEAEMEALTHHLNDILKYVEKLNTLDTSNVEPLSQVIDSTNVFRDDIVGPSLPREDALMNAPAHTDEFFRVPKVLGDK